MLSETDGSYRDRQYLGRQRANESSRDCRCGAPNNTLANNQYMSAAQGSKPAAEGCDKGDDEVETLTSSSTSYIDSYPKSHETTASKFTPLDQTPLGLHPWVHLAICFAFITFCGPILNNWPPMRQMLAASKAYFWLCNPEDILDSDGTCETQRVALTKLGNVAQTLAVLGSVIGGFAFDRLGPRACGVAGVLGYCISYFLMAMASKERQTYWGWVVFQGLSIELSYFGIMSSANLYPRLRRTIFGTMGGLRSLGGLFAYVQKIGTEKGSLRSTMLGFGFTAAAIVPVAFFVLPSRPFELVSPEPETHVETEVAAVLTEDGQSYTQMGRSSTFGTQTTVQTDLTGWRLLLKRLIDPFCIVWTIAYSLIYVTSIFYALSISEQSPAIKDVYGFILPFSMIPSFGLGWLMDKIGSLEVIIIQNLFRVLMFGLLMVNEPNTFVQSLPLICFLIQYGLLVSSNYALIQDYYEPEVQGRISGLLNAVAGLISLANTPYYEWATANDAFVKADGIYLVGVAVSLFLMMVMLFIGSARYRRRTLNKCRKTRRATSIFGGGAEIRRNNSSITSFTYAPGI